VLEDVDPAVEARNEYLLVSVEIVRDVVGRPPRRPVEVERLQIIVACDREQDVVALVEELRFDLCRLPFREPSVTSNAASRPSSVTIPSSLKMTRVSFTNNRSSSISGDQSATSEWTVHWVSPSSALSPYATPW